jgi:ribonuclease T2
MEKEMFKRALLVLFLFLGAVGGVAFNKGDFFSSGKRVTKVSSDNLLALSWQNAFCQTHRNKRECRALKPSDYASSHFTLHGLWPQPRSKVNCKGRKRIDLDRKLYRELLEVMPAAKSGLATHEWKKHGTCYGKDDDGYFKDAIALTKRINSSDVAELFSKNVGKRVTIEQVRKAFDKSFGKGSGRKVKLKCKNGLITEIWINLKGEITPTTPLSKLLKKAKNAHGGCRSGLVDSFGY